MTIAHNSNLAEVLHRFKSMMDRGYDVFCVITGMEGVGKSRGLFLNIIDYWYTVILGHKKVPEGRYNVRLEDFIQSLKTGKDYDICSLDEAGDTMDSQNFRDALNRILYQSYTIIREKRFFTLIVLPDFYDLNPRFRNRRVRGVFECFQRVDHRCKECNHRFVGPLHCPECKSKKIEKGFVRWRYFGRARINQIFEKTKNHKVKRLGVLSPTIQGIVEEYRGPMLKRYSKEKAQKMEEAIDMMYDLFSQATEEDIWRCPKCRRSDTRILKSDNRIHCRKCQYSWDPPKGFTGKKPKNPKKQGAEGEHE